MDQSDQFDLCKAALIFAITRWLLSFVLNLLANSMSLFSASSHAQTSSSSSSANVKTAKDSLCLTTVGNIQHRLPESSDMSCAVCLNKLRKKSQVLELKNCSHVFHKHCLERWLSYDDRFTCPLCRASLLTTAVTPLPPSWEVEGMLYLFGDDLLS